MEDEDIEWTLGCEVPGTVKLLQALVTGSQEQPTPEEQVSDAYNFYKTASSGETEANIMTAIERTLNLLNIKIEGVNA